MRDKLTIISRNIAGDERKFKVDTVATYLEGRMYERWIDSVSGSARSNGHNEDDLITNPAGIIESILRDEVFVERDLVLNTKISDNTYYVDDLRSVVEDYYNYSIIINVTRGEKDYISDYVYTAGNKRINTGSAHSTWAANDLIFLTNVQGDNKIDYASFDVVGNTTDGLRKDWVFNLNIYEETLVSNILHTLLTESDCILFTSHKKYKLVALDEASSADTWTQPIVVNGNKKFHWDLTTIRQLYNEYKLNYHYDVEAAEYKKSLFVNKSKYSPTLTNGATYQATCKSVFDTYGIVNKYEYDCKAIYDDDTAELLFNKTFEWYSRQRGLVEWGADVGNHIQYEVGDQVVLNNSGLIPTGINNSSKFVIQANPLPIVPGDPFINFELVEI